MTETPERAAPLTLSRLKSRADFLRVTRARTSAGMPGLVLQVARWRDGTSEDHAGGGDGARIGFTASRKVGNAVARNRAKRRLRALVAEVMPHYAVPGRDYVLIARNTTPSRSYAALRGDLVRAMKRLKVWRPAVPSGAGEKRGEAE